MTKAIKTAPQKTMLREVAAYHAKGYNWVPASFLSSSGREYDQERTVRALVRAGVLEQAPDGYERAYRATPAGVAWVDRDQELDSLGRRRGGPRSAIDPEVVARARQLLAERGPDGRRKYKMHEVADLVGLHRGTLSMQLYPERHERRLKQRRLRYKKGQQS